ERAGEEKRERRKTASRERRGRRGGGAGGRPRLVVDRGLRQAPRHGIAMAQCRRQVGRANSEEFLPWIDAIAMLRRERACRGNAFNVSTQQTSNTQRDDPHDRAKAQHRERYGTQ